MEPSPCQPHQKKNNSNPRVLLVNRVLSVVPPPVSTHPLRLRQRTRAPEALDNLALSLEDLQPKTFFPSWLARDVSTANKVKNPPADACHAIWQCNNHTPGLSGLNAIAMYPPAGSNTTSRRGGLSNRKSW